MQTFITAAGALALVLLLLLLVFAIGVCRGDACLWLGSLLGPLCLFSIVIFFAGVATWRSDRDHVDGLRPSFKAVVVMLGVVGFSVAALVFLAMTA
jgi:hypothetical protein